jgi:hypothetical protein
MGRNHGRQRGDPVAAYGEVSMAAVNGRSLLEQAAPESDVGELVGSSVHRSCHRRSFATIEEIEARTDLLRRRAT